MSHVGQPSCSMKCGAHGPRSADDELMRVAQAFAARGGLASSDTILLQMREHTAQPISRLARWVVERRVLSIQWQATLLLPLFQFQFPITECCAGLDAVLAEWEGVMPDPQIALWFTEANATLGGACPAALIKQDPIAVLGAARHDRFVIRW